MKRETKRTEMGRTTNMQFADEHLEPRHWEEFVKPSSRVIYVVGNCVLESKTMAFDFHGEQIH